MFGSIRKSAAQQLIFVIWVFSFVIFFRTAADKGCVGRWRFFYAIKVSRCEKQQQKYPASVQFCILLPHRPSVTCRNMLLFYADAQLAPYQGSRGVGRAIPRSLGYRGVTLVAKGGLQLFSRGGRCGLQPPSAQDRLCVVQSHILRMVTLFRRTQRI